MCIVRRWIVPVLAGGAVAALVVLAADRLIRSLGALLGWIGRLAGMDAAPQLAEIFGQLRDARIATPWIVVVPVCCAVALLTARLIRKRWVAVVLWAVVLVLTIGAAVWFADVNEIRFGAVIVTLPTLLKSGML